MTSTKHSSKFDGAIRAHRHDRFTRGKSRRNTPKIVNIVGCDGSGKSTQIEMLVPWVRGHLNRLSNLVTKADLYEEQLDWNHSSSYEDFMVRYLPSLDGRARSLELLYLFGEGLKKRTDHPRELLLLDGYWTKHLAIEVAMGLDEGWFRAVASRLPPAALTVLLDIDPAAAAHRICKLKPYECGLDKRCRTEHFISTQRRVRQVLLHYASDEGWPVVNAEASPDVIHLILRQILKSRLGHDEMAARRHRH